MKFSAEIKQLVTDGGRECRHLVMKMGLCIYWVVLAILTGLITGAYSTAFAYLLGKGNDFRLDHPWTLYLMPFAGLLIVFLYRKAGMTKDRGTNLILDSISSKDQVPASMALLIFVSTILTHFVGGSAGREGAALQMGGSIGETIARILKKNERESKLLIMCGMSAAFSAVFGTPMAAAVFSLEVISVGIMHYSALVPCVMASIIASRFAAGMGIRPELFPVADIPQLTVLNGTKIFLLAICCAAVAVMFCEVMHITAKLYQTFFKNPYLRVVAGSLIVIGLTLLVGNRSYNGAGVHLMEAAIIEGETHPWTFLLKMIFTALTLGAGFKGGEIVPSFCIGATFGCLFGQIAGISPGMCAAIGMAAVFCGVTNCPITTLLISFELFGFGGIPYFMIAIAVSYMMSGYRGLYSDQIIVYSKYRPRFINRHIGDHVEDDLTDRQ